MEKRYDYTTVLKLVEASFDAEGLSSFCFGRFGDIYEQFAGQTKGMRARLLVDHARKHGFVENLLEGIRVANSHQYEKFAPKIVLEKPAAGRKSGRRANFNRFVVKLCDRDGHDAEFSDFFNETCRNAACGYGPRFVIIHGSEHERHLSLVERFRQTYLRQHVEQTHRENAVIPKPIRAYLPNIRKLESLKQKFPEPVFNHIDRNYAGPFTADALAGLPAIGKHPAVVVIHHISAGLWRNHHAELLKWYMTEYWKGNFEGGPMFLIFFNIEYPKNASALKWFKIRRIRKKLDRLANSVRKVCPCLLIQEIGRIEKGEVVNWFVTQFPDDESIWRDRVDKFFKSESEKKTMAETEGFLMEVMTDIDKAEYDAQT